ncbi:uncharacterized protein LOC131281600 [Anopheles ziemanni]|uniref:uncharacterized protein LOC131265810 n=1 Tax=Anopheles coustani TaxID=139045 RepID=UPI00265B6B93|nr:uncharacterized protein LOC131265810 [Anopheles coustani]XP_058166925.1 uncharacterized protein LOC131281600 [Anopheles ziemanni]
MLAKKTPDPQKPSPKGSSPGIAKNQIRPFPSNEGLEQMMGFDMDDQSEMSGENTLQSQPNFSYLPSHKHSSPQKVKQVYIPTVHRLGSMSTVPNSDLVQPDTSNELSASDGIEMTPKSANSAPDKTLAKEKENQRRHSRKQKTPTEIKILREVVRLQDTGDTLIPKLSFGRVIREILADYSDSGLRVTLEMLECLQEAAEIYIVQLFEDAYRCTVHRGRVTLIPKDIQLALMIRRES